MDGVPKLISSALVFSFAFLSAVIAKGDVSDFAPGPRFDCSAQGLHQTGRGLARSEAEAKEIALRNCKNTFEPNEENVILCDESIQCVTSYRPLAYECTTVSRELQSGYVRNFSVSYPERADATRVVYSLCSHHCDTSLCRRNLQCSHY